MYSFIKILINQGHRRETVNAAGYGFEIFNETKLGVEFRQSISYIISQSLQNSARNGERKYLNRNIMS